jgi:hypothetical protein
MGYFGQLMKVEHGQNGKFLCQFDVQFEKFPKPTP